MTKEHIIKFADWLDDIKPGQPGNTENSPSVQFLSMFMTDEEAVYALMTEPYFQTAAEMAEKYNVPAEDIIHVLDKLGMDGIIMSSSLSGEIKYRRWPWIPGILEYVVLDKNLPPDKLAFVAKFFETYNHKKDITLYPNMTPGKGGLRTIPILESVEAKSQILPYETVKHFMDKASKFSVANCACRTTARILGRGCEHTHIDTCIQLNDYADFAIRTNRAREITYDEACEILKKMEKAGHVHQVFNTQGPDTTCFICNCCGCSCTSLRSVNLMNLQEMNRSNFRAEVDPEKCVGCGVCVESCNTNALSLGSVFCKDIKVSKDLPDVMDTNWTEEFWDKEFLKRKMVHEVGTAPCKTACPAHISVQGYIRKAAQGKYDEALKVIKRENPFPAVCGRICPHDCENECTRARVDEAMAIDDIKKFIADKELNEKDRFVPTVDEHYTEKVAVIGSGPAGLTAAYYCAAQGYPVTVFERRDGVGGMLRFGIPSFRLEKDVIDAEIDVLRKLGVEFRTGVDVGRDITIQQLREEGYKAFYLAIGAQKSRKLNVEGEDLNGVRSGIEFLQDVNYGRLSAVEGDTIVIGGGNVAIDVARAALRLGNRNVKMFCLEKDEEMPTVPDEKDEAIAENVQINNCWGPKRILGENGKVTGVEFKKCVSVFAEDGSFAPIYDENETVTVPCSNVFVAIGQAMDWGKLLDGTAAQLGAGNVVKVESITYQTGESDIFAGGDCATGPKFTIDAIATGKSGAISIHRFLRGNHLSLRREREYKAFDKDIGDYSGYDKMPRQRPHHAAASKAVETMSDTRATFTEEQLRKEAERCLGCGISIVDPKKCLGCGVCANRCEFDAIKVRKVYEDAPASGPQEFVMNLMGNARTRMQNIMAKAASAGQNHTVDITDVKGVNEFKAGAEKE